jgi:hypothetical protein
MYGQEQPLFVHLESRDHSDTGKGDEKAIYGIQSTFMHENGILTGWTYRYPFDHQSQAMLGLVSALMGDQPNDEYAGCC